MFSLFRKKGITGRPFLNNQLIMLKVGDVEDSDSEKLLCWAGDCYKYGINTPRSIYKAGYFYFQAWKKGSELGKVKLYELKGDVDLKNEFERLQKEKASLYHDGMLASSGQTDKNYIKYITHNLLLATRSKASAD